MDKHDLQMLYERVLAARIASLEKMRKQVRLGVVVGAALFLFALVVTYVSWERLFAPEPGSWQRFLPMAVALLDFVVLPAGLVKFGFRAATSHLGYRARFKREIVAEIFRQIRPESTYFPDRSIPREVFDASGLFRRELDVFGADDLLRGRLSGVAYEACDIDASFRMRAPVSSGAGSGRVNRLAVFHGLFFHIQLPDRLRGRTVVRPRRAKRHQLTPHRGLQRVGLGQAKFEENFAVWTNDPAEASSVLAPEVQQRLLELSHDLDAQIHVSCTDGRLYVACHLGRALFEPTIRKTVTLQQLEGIAELFSGVEVLVAGFARGLAAPSRIDGPSILDEEREASELVKIAEDGEVTVDELLDVGRQAGDAALGGAGSGIQPTPPPPGLVSINPSMSGGLEFRFPLLRTGFVIAFVISVALAPFLAAAAAYWYQPETGDLVYARILSHAPWLAQVVKLAKRVPTISLLSTLVVWYFAMRRWLAVPRVVEIGPRGITIARGPFPLARFYAHEKIKDAENMDSYVVLTRHNASIVRRYVNVAPTMPSPAMARWLALEIQRALKSVRGM